MIREPPRGQVDHLLERARLFEEVASTRHDRELLLAAQLRERGAIQLDDDRVAASDDQERRGADLRECGAREIGSSPARHDRADLGVGAGRGNERAAAAPVLAPK